ncbi:MAG TPA: hypothetical protein VFL49_09455, partial [Pseudolabrys sp.]|nr:hypothetical protein [Pseudolabrys sp.]
MPQVASDPKVHAASFHTPRVARPAPPDRAPSPFESLIEDTSPPAEPAPPPESKVTRSDDKPAPAKSTDCKPAEPNDDPKPAETDNVAGEPAVDDSTAEAVGKKTAKPRTAAGVGDSIQAGAEDEPATEQKTSDAGTTTTDGAVTVTSSEAISIVPAPAQVPNTENQQTEQPLQQLALVADTKPKMMQL